MMYDELIEQLRIRASWLEFAIIKTPSKTEGNRDAILFRKAADAIEELQKITTHYEEESKGWWLAACDAKEERERLKEQIPKWIPVTERLPEENDVVLITDGYNTGTAFLIDGYGWNSPFDDVNTSHITHWMPLPKPPKEET